MRPGIRIAALLAAAPLAAAADPGALDVDFKVDGAITAAAAAAALGLNSRWLAPSSCRVCGVGELDASVQERLALAPAAAAHARTASDILANGVLPAFGIAAVAIPGLRDGGPREAAEGVLVVAEAAALAADASQIAKDAVARRRPGPFGARNQSFYSGHTSLAFSLATAAGTVETIRGDGAAPWVWGIGLALATGVGWLRVAGDAHWLTDVAAGAAIGGGIGFAVPWFLHRGRRRGGGGIEIYPAPGGIALRF